MPDDEQLPTAVALHREREAGLYPVGGQSDLDSGPEDRFLASDPVSAAHTAISIRSPLARHIQLKSQNFLNDVRQTVRDHAITATAKVASRTSVFGATR